jgi:hypothetical protein
MPTITQFQGRMFAPQAYKPGKISDLRSRMSSTRSNMTEA